MIHPSLAFKIESIIFGITGLSYLLAPSWNAQLLFGHQMLRSVAPFASSLMMAMGGTLILLASTMCTASETATQNMCVSVAAGHMFNVALKCFCLLSGWAGDTRKGAIVATFPEVTMLMSHLVFAGMMWVASTHPAAKKTPLHGSITGMVKEKAAQMSTDKGTAGGVTH